MPSPPPPAEAGESAGEGLAGPCPELTSYPGNTLSFSPSWEGSALSPELLNKKEPPKDVRK